jgi:hypothetical protein
MDANNRGPLVIYLHQKDNVPMLLKENAIGVIMLALKLQQLRLIVLKL